MPEDSSEPAAFRCMKCKEVKLTTEFSRNRSTKTGFHTYCKPSRQAASRLPGPQLRGQFPSLPPDAEVRDRRCRGRRIRRAIDYVKEHSDE